MLPAYLCVPFMSLSLYPRLSLVSSIPFTISTLCKPPWIYQSYIATYLCLDHYPCLYWKPIPRYALLGYGMQKVAWELYVGGWEDVSTPLAVLLLGKYLDERRTGVGCVMPYWLRWKKYLIGWGEELYRVWDC